MSAKNDRNNGGRGKGSVLDPGIIPSDSMANLTKPTLYSLYDEDIADPSESSSIYKTLSANARVATSSAAAPAVHRSVAEKVFSLIKNLVILSVSGILYLEVSKNLHDNHQLHASFTSKPVVVITRIQDWLFQGAVPLPLQQDWVKYAIEGVLFGSVVPVLDLVFLQKDKAQARNGDSTLFGILRIANAMLGVTYGIRKLQWSSSLQAAGVWGLLNIVLWLFFDGTPSLLFESLIASVGVTLGCVYEFDRSSFDVAQFLYFEDFYFLGFIIFGKLGRFLFF
ncbi:Nsg2 protein [Maudiozyma humilis]|uniref:Nsg2 protein n=1 Tax=Maudiozyma humilis TaxID=51915 RepID=A0AAV5RV14_MAUHU|nr:Nsg2 protein [Kazachstania humilis]